MKTSQVNPASASGLSPLKVAIILLALATAFIHGVLLNLSMGHLDLLFTLNSLGYLILLGAYVLPLPVVKDNRSLVRWALIGFTVVTIIAWIILGRPYTLLGIITKVVEVALIAALYLDGRA